MTFAGVVFDLDGTLYRGSEAIPGAAEVVSELRHRGIAIRFLTNNSSGTPESVAEKMTRMGFGVASDEIVTSGTLAAQALAERGIQRAFVVGEAGLVSVLADHGTTSVAPEMAEVVVVGICRHFTYDIMDQALQACRAGASLVATNRDPTFPLEQGRFAPGAGSIVAAIEACSGLTAEVFGKPEPLGVRHCCTAMGLPPEQVVCVGDRLDTDIAAGKQAGCQVFVVDTGVTPSIPAGLPGGSLKDLLES